MLMFSRKLVVVVVVVVVSTVLWTPIPGDAFSTVSSTTRVTERRVPVMARISSSSMRLAVAATVAGESATNDKDASSSSGVEVGTNGRPEPPLSSLPLPPQKGGILRRFRDTISYLKDPDGFIEQRSHELGPVFTMYQFFKPVVVVGGQEAVREFIKEREEVGKVIYPDLPPTFVDLHTKWSALNMDSTQEEFRQARGLFKGLLQAPEARNMYVQTILPEIEQYVERLVERVREHPEEEQFLVPELKELCLQIFARIFSGEGTLFCLRGMTLFLPERLNCTQKCEWHVLRLYILRLPRFRHCLFTLLYF